MLGHCDRRTPAAFCDNGPGTQNRFTLTYTLRLPRAALRSGGSLTSPEIPGSRGATPRWWRRPKEVTFGAVLLALIASGITVGVERLAGPSNQPLVLLPPAASLDPASGPSTMTPSSQLEPLSIVTSWPRYRGCDAATQTAFPDSVPAGQPGDGGAANPDLRDNILNNGGAAWVQGHLTMTMTGIGDAVVAITNLKQLVYKKTDSAPAWLYVPLGGCGDVYERLFALNLDNGSFRDMGIQGEARTGVAPPSEALGPAFTVSRADPALIVVDVLSCHGYYEWGLEVTYVVEGSQRVKVIGTPTQPLRSWGATSATTRVFTTNMLGPGLIDEGQTVVTPRQCSSAQS